MVKIIIVFGIIAALSAVIHQTNAVLKCYACGPDIDGTDCFNGILNEANETSCTLFGITATKCLKATATHNNGTEYMMRGCDWTSGCNTTDPTLSDYKDIDCYNCDSDLCNSSKWNSANLVTMCLIVFVTYLFMLK